MADEHAYEEAPRRVFSHLSKTLVAGAVVVSGCDNEGVPLPDSGPDSAPPPGVPSVEGAGADEK